MKLENAQENLTVINADITNSSFKNVRAEQLTLQCCNLSGMKMNDVNLTGLHISDANLSELVIDGAQWGGAHFRYIGFDDGGKSKPEPEPEPQQIRTVRFSDCNFKQGAFTDCDFTNVRLENCDVSGLVINGINVGELLKQQAAAEQK